MYEGETIPINVENTSRLAQAVDVLRGQAPLARRSRSRWRTANLTANHPRSGDPARESVAYANPEFARVENLFFSAIDKLTCMSEGKLDEGRRYAIQSCVMLARDQLEMIALATNR